MYKGHAAAVMIVTPQGIPLVRDPTKDPSFWKFPGGHGNFMETPEDCAIREVREEIGISLQSGDLTVIYGADRGDHFFTLFIARLSRLPDMREEGDEGEEIKVSTPGEILAMDDFFPSYFAMAEATLKTLV